MQFVLISTETQLLVVMRAKCASLEKENTNLLDELKVQFNIADHIFVLILLHTLYVSLLFYCAEFVKELA